jgi:hypothetical protein
MMIWRLLASGLRDRRQRGRLAVCPACQPVHEPRRPAFLAFACLVCRALRCGDLGAILARRQHFRVAYLALPLW